ncbi:polysaccharide deacetylase family protein [Luteimonas lutimaris]|uniref:NodB homology domain-containing protein n=1 Tax=Luteimonas lutimaris TaxID=698645 RepID=A0ABP7MHE9_9GAMM
MSTALPVLMYHGLHAGPDSRGRFDPVYSVHPDAFTAQLDWLLRNGYRSIGASARTATADGRRVAITFDDGDVSNLEVALPLLRERGMVATFFITSGFVDQPGMLSSAQVALLADAGMEIGAHGRSHAFLEDLDDAALAAELRDSRTRLSALTGRAVESMALPGGRGSERERRAARALGYTHLFGSVPGPNRNPDRDRWLQRIAVTRGMALEEFASLVAWRGPRPRLSRMRFEALSWPKRVLGNAGYERLRARLLKAAP